LTQESDILDREVTQPFGEKGGSASGGIRDDIFLVDSRQRRKEVKKII
jgi:general stress protein YciG